MFYGAGMGPSKQITTEQKEIVLMESLKKNILRVLLLYMLILNVFLFLRVFIRIFGADPNNFFAGFVYLVSGFLLLPFFGIIPEVGETIIAGENKVDISALLAWFCLNILVLLAMAIAQIAFTILKSRKQTSATMEKKKTMDTSIIEHAVR